MVVLLITEVNVYFYGLSQELSKAHEKSGVQNRWYYLYFKGGFEAYDFSLFFGGKLNMNGGIFFTKLFCLQ